jgi:RecB family exonuclease
MSKISYSSFSTYLICSLRWKYEYIDGIRDTKPSISLIFGDAMHKVLQTYFQALYKKSTVVANKIDLHELLKITIKELYLKGLTQNGNKHYSTKEELTNIYNDGILILNFFKENRNTYFDKNVELIGIEHPLDIPSDINTNIKIIGYIDMIVKNNTTNKYIIYDFKTSVYGWNKAAKKDEIKISQLLLYKKVVAAQFNIDINDIDIEFIIFKRKLYESEFKQSRIQTFRPASGKVSINKVNNKINEFIKKCFNSDGSFNVENNNNYLPNPEFKNCRYCQFFKSDKCKESYNVVNPFYEN